MKNKPPVLKSRTAIGLVFEKGKKIFKFPITILYRENGSDSNGFLYCSDRTSKKSVDRNRVKRTLRAVIYEIYEDIPKGYDFAIIAGWKFSELKYIDRIRKMRTIFQKINK